MILQPDVLMGLMLQACDLQALKGSFRYDSDGLSCWPVPIPAIFPLKALNFIKVINAKSDHSYRCTKHLLHNNINADRHS